MKFKLTAREKSELFGEGIVTIILLLLLNIATFVVLDQLIASNPELENGIFQIKMSLSFGPNNIRIWSWGWLFGVILLIGDGAFIYWRLIRRYRQMQLRHIIAELHYIADGHFDHRIPFQISGQMQKVVSSVNALVDSTIKAMEDEREIERSKDELITNVSHDIRTPLTSIIGYLGLIENKQYHSEEDILKYTHTAYLKSREMKVLVDDLFEYTKVQQVDAPLQLTRLNVCQMLEQIAAGFELEAQNRQIQLTVDVPKEPLYMEADGEKLARVFNNLITNAFKYGTGAKNIYLTLRQSSPEEIKITVANDGKPIPKEALEHVFERFYRAESSRSRATGGTGLGLAIAQGIVQLHHGFIYVTSNEKLTSFIINLPVKHQEK
ncbi:sensor histidine kinase [Ligilactobacillus ceti]|uniref:histidine kinase n=1 Tax=Ligilactobacillus ceti DSM 22408 TaxID=1122146 RepID=A0A0R2KS12_9LACO|nr:HAMP domain-containing sensor histidine kinase [Ligilactobacillus ceti]KRN89370.1 two component system histidine kinase [Ligilactobacillus ceti DSM 22408]